MENKEFFTTDELIAKLRLEILAKEQLISEQEREILEKSTLLARLLEENERLRNQLNQLLQDKFGAKSEKSKNLEKNLFDEAKQPDNQPSIEEAEGEISVAAHKRRKGGKAGRKPLPEHLPRVQQIYDLEESQKICHCGCQLVKIGEEVTEQLDIVPAKVQVVQHIKYKYACHGCEGTIATAAGPRLPIPKSIASPGLLAHVAVSKFKDHLPLYRQENIFRRMGVDIVRHTAALWMIKMAKVLLPIYKLGQDIIIHHDVAFADETRVQVLKEPNRSAQAKAYMWCFIGGPIEKRCVIYHYNISRSHQVIEEILAGFSGFLHCDGFSGYDAYAADHDVKLVGCWMHCRRNFFEVAITTQSRGLAAEALERISQLFAIEEHMKSNRFTFQQRYEHRQSHSKPLLEQFKSFVDDHVSKVLPKSPLGQAFSYAVNQWQKLIRYLEDGRLEIDNGISERKMKAFATGRKNWLFCNSIAGARAAEVIFSVIAMCDEHGIEPFAYLKFVLTKLSYAKTVEDIEKLMPFNIKPEMLSASLDPNNTS